MTFTTSYELGRRFLVCALMGISGLFLSIGGWDKLHKKRFVAGAAQLAIATALEGAGLLGVWLREWPF